MPLLLYSGLSACWGMATFNCLQLILKTMALKIEGYYPLTISLNHPVSSVCIPIKKQGVARTELSKQRTSILANFFFFLVEVIMF